MVEEAKELGLVGAARFDSFKDDGNKYGLTDITEIAVLFDGIDVLLKQNLIDINMVTNSSFQPFIYYGPE